MRRFGWVSLLLVLAIAAACGPPTVTDAGGDSSGIGGGGGGGGGDDDDDGGGGGGGGGTPSPGASSSGTNTPTGSPRPTLTNVPSFATWDASIRSLGCAQCHSGGAGGLFMAPSNPAAEVKKSAWFSAICNRNNFGGGTQPGAGIQVYSPTAMGRYIAFYCNQRYDMNADGDTNDTGEFHNAAGMQSGCETVRAWLQTGTATPPSCLASFDLANSQ